MKRVNNLSEYDERATEKAWERLARLATEYGEYLDIPQTTV
ncbi:MAG: hypothetical protein RTV41_04895 [Candidatus Thorarchaeota archaeon]